MLKRQLPKFHDLRDFLAYLARVGQLVRVAAPVSMVHEATEIHRRVLEAGGPALLFEHPIRADGTASPTPVLVNLFGTVERTAWGLGVTPEALPQLGEMLAELREPRPPKDLAEVWRKLPLAGAALSTRVKSQERPPSQAHVFTGDEVDLGALPIQLCWPDEPGPLITWPLVITAPPDAKGPDSYNVGVYRMQVLGRDRALMRWLAHRGGAQHWRLWAERGLDTPVAVAIGAAPSTVLAAVLPLPEGLSELAFSGLLRGERPALSPCVTVPLMAPSEAEFVIEGFVSATETAPEGPFGDHTGYYNAVEPFPVMRVTAITHRRSPIYLSTYTGRPPDEPSRIGEALNSLFVPLVRRQFPEVTDLWLPPEACSYRIAVVAMRKRYPGQARRLMMGLWSMLPQLTYAKMIIVVDPDIAVRDWAQVMWAISTRCDSSRDLLSIADTPIDYLDFASPKSGLGGKLGIDATVKIPPETERAFGRPLAMSPEVRQRVDALWPELGLRLNR